MIRGFKKTGIDQLIDQQIEIVLFKEGKDHQIAPLVTEAPIIVAPVEERNKITAGIESIREALLNAQKVRTEERAK